MVFPADLHLVHAEEPPCLPVVRCRLDILDFDELEDVAGDGEHAATAFVTDGDAPAGLGGEIAPVTHRHRMNTVRVEPFREPVEVCPDGAALPAADDREVRPVVGRQQTPAAAAAGAFKRSGSSGIGPEPSLDDRADGLRDVEIVAEGAAADVVE